MNLHCLIAYVRIPLQEDRYVRPICMEFKHTFAYVCKVRAMQKIVFRCFSIQLFFFLHNRKSYLSLGVINVRRE